MTGTKFTQFEEGTTPEWSHLYQLVGAANGYTKWQRLWSLTGVDDDTNYTLTVRNHGTIGGGRHAQFLHSSTGVAVVQITDAGIALTGTITSTPVGSVVMYAGSSLPSKWIRCDGTVLSQTTYALLFAAIGTTFNTGGEGAGNFRVPDMRSRFPITVSGSFALGATGGASTINEAHTHPGSHSHGMNNHVHGLNAHTHGGGSYSYSSSTNTGTNSSSLNFNEGGGANHTAALDGHIHSVTVSGSISGSSGGNSGNTDVAGPSTTETDSNAPAASFTSGTSTPSILNPYFGIYFIIYAAA